MLYVRLGMDGDAGRWQLSSHCGLFGLKFGWLWKLHKNEQRAVSRV